MTPSIAERMRKVRRLMASPHAGEAAAARIRYEAMIEKYGHPQPDRAISTELLKRARDEVLRRMAEDARKAALRKQAALRDMLVAEQAARWMRNFIAHSFAARQKSGRWSVYNPRDAFAASALTDAQFIATAMEWGWDGK